MKTDDKLLKSPVSVPIFTIILMLQKAIRDDIVVTLNYIIMCIIGNFYSEICYDLICCYEPMQIIIVFGHGPARSCTCVQLLYLCYHTLA